MGSWPLLSRRPLFQLRKIKDNVLSTTSQPFLCRERRQSRSVRIDRYAAAINEIAPVAFRNEWLRVAETPYLRAPTVACFPRAPTVDRIKQLTTSRTNVPRKSTNEQSGWCGSIATSNLRSTPFFTMLIFRWFGGSRKPIRGQSRLSRRASMRIAPRGPCNRSSFGSWLD